MLTIAITSTFQSWMSTQNAGQLIGLVSVVGGLFVGFVAILAGTWAKVRRSEHAARRAEWEAALKPDMINRGMSADEIERVLAASQGHGSAEYRADCVGSK